MNASQLAHLPPREWQVSLSVSMITPLVVISIQLPPHRPLSVCTGSLFPRFTAPLIAVSKAIFLSHIRIHTPCSCGWAINSVSNAKQAVLLFYLSSSSVPTPSLLNNHIINTTSYKGSIDFFFF